MRSTIQKHTHQIAILEKECAKFENLESENHEFDKIYKTLGDNYELLKKYIDEVNIYTKEFHDRINIKLNMKADNDNFSQFQSNVEEKVLSHLNKKIDKIELRRAQNALRKQLDKLEDRVVDLKQGPKVFGAPGLINSNKKCISCFRELPENLYQMAYMTQ